MSIESTAVSVSAGPRVPPELASLFSRRLLLVTERQEEYDALFYSVAQTIWPTNNLEWIQVRKYVDVTWEIWRLRRHKTAIINMTRHDALRTILESILPQDKLRLTLAAELADAWYEKPAERPIVMSYLRSNDLDDEAISAQALALRSSEIEKIDRMIHQLEISGMALLREIEYHRRACSWHPPKKLMEIVDAVPDPVPLEGPDVGGECAETP
jgi:hypothetical protein